MERQNSWRRLAVACACCADWFLATCQPVIVSMTTFVDVLRCTKDVCQYTFRSYHSIILAERSPL